jgi:stage II sporulation protein M
MLVSAVILLFGIAAGYYLAEVYPSQSQELITALEETYAPMLKMNRASQILFIFLKNSLTAFSTIVFGAIFGILPIISLFSNGEILGILAGFTLEKFNLSYFLAGILPHGIIEISCFLISSAIGLRIGKTLIKKIVGKGGSIKEEINLGLGVFLRVILIFLFLAAIIEVLVSSELMGIY